MLSSTEKCSFISKFLQCMIMSLILSSVVFFAVAMNLDKSSTRKVTNTTYETVETYYCWVTKSGSVMHRKDCDKIKDKGAHKTTEYEAIRDGYVNNSSCCNYKTETTRTVIEVPVTKTQTSTFTVHDWGTAASISLIVFVVSNLTALICLRIVKSKKLLGRKEEGN